MFMDALDVDETLAQLLVAEGFTELEEVAYVELDELAVDRRLRRGDALAELPHLTEAMLVTLGKAGSRRSTIWPISPLTN
jgi:N utilization substance protein A